MNNIIEMILGSALIGSLITAIFSYIQNNNKNKAEYIAKHRTETENSKLLRDIIPKIYDAKNLRELKKKLIRN